MHGIIKPAAATLAAAVFMCAACACSRTPKPGDAVAYVEGDPSMNITYGDFDKEYRFYLYESRLSDDSADAAAMRKEVIDYQIKQRIYLRAAEDMGIGASSLTAEDDSEIDSRVETWIADRRESFRDEARAAFAKPPSDENLEKRITMLYQRFMRESGLDVETVRSWTRDEFIAERLMEKIVEDVAVSEEEIDTAIADMTEKAKADFAENPNVYVKGYVNYGAYIPNGTRDVRQVLIKFDGGVTGSIAQIREGGGETAEADAIAFRDSALEPIKDKAQAALDNINETGEFGGDRLRVPPGFTLYGSEYAETVFSLKEGEHSGLIPTDEGWAIVLYEGESAFTPEQIKATREEVASTYLDFKKVTRKNELVAEWQTKYPYVTDKKKLRIQ